MNHIMNRPAKSNNNTSTGAFQFRYCWRIKTPTPGLALQVQGMEVRNQFFSSISFQGNPANLNAPATIRIYTVTNSIYDICHRGTAGHREKSFCAVHCVQAADMILRREAHAVRPYGSGKVHAVHEDASAFNIL
jgi:hypothetical protein